MGASRWLTLPAPPGHGIVALLTLVPGGPGRRSYYRWASGRMAARPAPQPDGELAGQNDEQHDDRTVQLPVAVCRNPTNQRAGRGHQVARSWVNADRDAELTGSGARATVK